MAEGVRTQVKRKFIEFNRTLRKPLGEADILVGIRALHERLGDREFFLSYGQGRTGMKLLEKHIRTVLPETKGPKMVVIREGSGVRMTPGTQKLGRGLTAITMKTKRGGKEMFLMRKGK